MRARRKQEKVCQRAIVELRADRLAVDLEIGATDILRHAVDQRFELGSSFGEAHASRAVRDRRHRTRARTRSAARGQRKQTADDDAGEAKLHAWLRKLKGSCAPC